MNAQIQKFIRDDAGDNVAALALKKPPAFARDNYPLILDQIRARQKAAKKMPQWGDIDGIIYPPADIVEQASSLATAHYKASIMSGEMLVDLTGGAGVDVLTAAPLFKKTIAVDQNICAAEILSHNARCMNIVQFEAFAMPAEQFVKTMPSADWIMIDPQRRDQLHKGKFLLEDCSPDILDLLPELLVKSGQIMLKASPMLDITQSIRLLGGHVHEVHILDFQGDCKELLFIIRPEICNDPIIKPTQISGDGQIVAQIAFTLNDENAAKASLSAPLKYLYEPCAAFLKSGGFNTIATYYDIHKLHPHTHLYTHQNRLDTFPGRSFEIIAAYPVKASNILPNPANITVRNFPMSAQNLHKKLKIRVGGDDTLFACTLNNDQKAVLHCRKPLKY